MSHGVMTIRDDLMTREEVAAYLGIDPESVRSTMRRHGVTELRGYPRSSVVDLGGKRRAHDGRQS